MRFTIRDWFWLIICVALSLGWFLDTQTRPPINKYPSNGVTSNWSPK